MLQNVEGSEIIAIEIDPVILNSQGITKKYLFQCSESLFLIFKCCKPRFPIFKFLKQLFLIVECFNLFFLIDGYINYFLLR